MSHGYNLKNKSGESSIMLFPNFINKNEENKHSSFSKNNLANKNIKRIPLQDSYNDLIEKRKNQIEYLKNNEEQKLKEICTFKPQINISVNKELFSNKMQLLFEKK
jgi:tRNA U34 5-carboxymethylaminomethyl modifying enzyme MnmG/GidA